MGWVGAEGEVMTCGGAGGGADAVNAVITPIKVS